MSNRSEPSVVSTIQEQQLRSISRELAAERLLPMDAVGLLGFLVSAIGALAVLLAYEIAAQLA